MPRDEPTEDIVRREISRARQILREDRVIAAHRELLSRLSRLDPKPGSSGNPPEPGSPGNPPAPNPKDPPADPPPKRGVWWGQT